MTNCIFQWLVKAIYVLIHFVHTILKAKIECKEKDTRYWKSKGQLLLIGLWSSQNKLLAQANSQNNQSNALETRSLLAFP